MNIFFLDESPKISASYYVDSHVRKIILEAAQMLCTAHHLSDSSVNKSMLYKSTHINHPMTKWVRSSKLAYLTTYELFRELGQEFVHRFAKSHKTIETLGGVLSNTPNLSDNYQNPPTCMPVEYIKSNVIDSYRYYYAVGKKHLHKWTNRSKPEWI